MERTAEEKKREQDEYRQRYRALTKEMDAYRKEVIENSPELIGSPKQVAWAERLRKQFLHFEINMLEQSRIQAEFRDGAPYRYEFSDPKKNVEFYGKLIEDLRAITSAKYWIDNRITSDNIIISEKWHFNRTLERMGEPYRYDEYGREITVEAYNKTGGRIRWLKNLE